MMGGIVTRNI